MKDTKLMIAVIGCFAIAVLFILVIVWEIKKSIDYGQKVRRLSANVTKTVEDDNRDFSIYESIVGVDEREMILIPEGVFTRGSDGGGFDEKQMLARLSFTDFNGQEFMNNVKNEKKINNELILKFAPKIVEGVYKLKKWSESI